MARASMAMRIGLLDDLQLETQEVTGQDERQMLLVGVDLAVDPAKERSLDRAGVWWRWKLYFGDLEACLRVAEVMHIRSGHEVVKGTRRKRMPVSRILVVEYAAEVWHLDENSGSRASYPVELA